MFTLRICFLNVILIARNELNSIKYSVVNSD